MIDYTTMRKGSKPTGGRRIATCPICGRKGLPSLYTGKKSPYGMMTHAGSFDGLFVHVTDQCYLSEEQAESLKEQPR